MKPPFNPRLIHWHVRLIRHADLPCLLLIFIPILAALAILLGAGPQDGALAGFAQLAVALFAFLLTTTRRVVPVSLRSRGRAGVEAELRVGADGLSLVMLLLTGIVTLAAVWVTPKIEKRENLFYACVLLISAGAAGAFASTDLFFFYAFHELALIPTFLLIGFWGTGRALHRRVEDHHLPRRSAASSCSSASWISISRCRGFAHVRHHRAPAARGERPHSRRRAKPAFHFPAHRLRHPHLALSVPLLGAAGLCLRADTGGHAARRRAEEIRPLRPDPRRPAAAARGREGLGEPPALLLVGNIIYVGLVTIAQKKLDLLLGYSSVMHMGYIFLGIAALNIVGVSGAALLMFAHGLSIAALFAMAGILRERKTAASP